MSRYIILRINIFLKDMNAFNPLEILKEPLLEISRKIDNNKVYQINLKILNLF